MIKIKMLDIAKHYGKKTRAVSHQFNKYGGFHGAGIDTLYKVLSFYEKKKK